MAEFECETCEDMEQVCSECDMPDGQCSCDEFDESTLIPCPDCGSASSDEEAEEDEEDEPNEDD